MLFKRLDDVVRIQREVAHDLRERVPLQLGKRKEQMFARDLAMFAAAGFVDGPSTTRWADSPTLV
jgi:hypothetical protein